MDVIEPQSIPEPIVKRKEAINLYFIGVGALALVSVLTVLGGLLLAWADKPVPGELWAFAGVALGALSGMISRDTVK